MPIPITSWSAHFKGKKLKDKKDRTSQMLVRLDINIHMEVRAQAAYRNQSMKDYVIDAVLAQIAQDKKYQKEDVR